MGPRAGLDRCGKSRPTGIRSPDRPARSQSLYRLSYPAHRKTIRINYEIMLELKEKGSNFQVYFAFEVCDINKAGNIRTEIVRLEPKCV